MLLGILAVFIASLLVECLPLLEQRVYHNQALVDHYLLYLRNVFYDLSQQEEVLVAQDRLEQFELLDLGMVVYDLSILNQYLDDILFIDFVIEGAVEFERYAPELVGLSSLRVLQAFIIAQLAQL